MVQLVREYITANYAIGELFYTSDLYERLMSFGCTRSQISTALNGLKKQGAISNEANNEFNTVFNQKTRRRPPKLWIRLK